MRGQKKGGKNMGAGRVEALVDFAIDYLNCPKLALNVVLLDLRAIPF